MTAESQPQRAPPNRRGRLDAVRAEDYPEVAEIAFGLFQADQARSDDREQRRIALEAATEAGVPAEYMEQAATLLHQRRVEAVRRRHRLRMLLLGAAAAVVLTLGGVLVARQLLSEPEPRPLVERFDDAPGQRWTLNQNPESRAALTFAAEHGGREGVAVVTVERFSARPGDGSFFVNLDSTDGSKDLSGLTAAVFLVRGDGLGHVRLYLERGANERWRSPPVPVTADWQVRRVSLDQFEHQTRDESGAWRVRDNRPPDRVDRLSFKLGTFVNDLGSRGEVAIDDLQIE